MDIIPIITKVEKAEGVFLAFDASNNLLFVTTNQTVVDTYFFVPKVITEQAEKIAQLETRLSTISNNYNDLIMRLIPNGSNLIH